MSSKHFRHGGITDSLEQGTPAQRPKGAIAEATPTSSGSSSCSSCEVVLNHHSPHFLFAVHLLLVSLLQLKILSFYCNRNKVIIIIITAKPTAIMYYSSHHSHMPLNLFHYYLYLAWSWIEGLVLVLLKGSCSLKQHVEGVAKLTGEPEAGAVLYIPGGFEDHGDWDRVPGIDLVLVGGLVSFYQGVLQG
jgi:hypothetical protein